MPSVSVAAPGLFLCPGIGERVLAWFHLILMRTGARGVLEPERDERGSDLVQLSMNLTTCRWRWSRNQKRVWLCLPAPDHYREREWVL